MRRPTGQQLLVADVKRFNNILFVAQPQADNAVAFARALTLAENNQASLTVVGIVEVSEQEKSVSDSDTRLLVDAMAEQRLQELRSLLSEAGADTAPVEVKALAGTTFLEIIREVIGNDRDLVIKSVESVGGIAHLFGSTDMKLLRKCPCPVWLIKPAADKGYREIMAALDYDPEDQKVDELNGQILEMAASLALSDFAQLHVVHAWRLPHEAFLRSARTGFSDPEVDVMAGEEEARRRHWLEGLVERHCTGGAAEYLKPHFHMPKGNPARLVPELAEGLGAELIVMGTVAHTGIPGFVVGNTAENILHQIGCSVLTVKPAGFVSPVSLPIE